MKFKGTKGKWEFRDGYAMDIVTSDDRSFGIVDLGTEQDAFLADYPLDELKANAKLIASAPEMFEELKETIIDLKILRNQIESEVKTNHLFKGMPELIQIWINRKEKLLTKITQ